MIEVSKTIRILFNRAKGDIDLPGFNNFPNNSCEGAALFLGAVLKKYFPSSPILYVKGEDNNGASHYWLESENLIYDITADQFTQFQEPIFGESEQSLIELFPILTKVPVLEALEKSDVTTETYKKTMQMDLECYLTNRSKWTLNSSVF